MNDITPPSASVPLHFRSYYSLLRGCLSPEAICRHAAGQGHRCVALSDVNNLYGLIRFLSAARQTGIKPICGVDFAPRGRTLFSAYAMNRSGYARINSLLSAPAAGESDAAAVRSEEGLMREMVDGGWEGLTVVSQSPAVLERLAWRERSGLYLGLLFGGGFHRACRWARERRFPLMAVTSTVYLREEDRLTYDLLRAISLNVTVESIPEEERCPLGGRAPAGGELEAFFSPVPEALRNAGKLAEEAEAESVLNPSPVFPRYRDLSEAQSFRRLRGLCRAGVGRRYGRLTVQIEERLDHELRIIRDKRFAGYFLVVHDIVSRCPRTCGRGSSAASIVSYLLGITHVDPLRLGLFFERFLHHGRRIPPDIDVDFPWDERSKVFDYVFHRYAGRAGMVANHVRFGSQACIRRAAGALGVAGKEIDRCVRLWQLGRGQEIPSFIRSASLRIRGFPHYLGTHCGGVVITPDAITRFTHTTRSAAGLPVIAWEKDAAVEAGLVKIDLLGNRSLSVLRDALRLTCSSEDGDGSRALNDPETRRMIERGETVGIFYIESPATRQLLKKMRRGDYEHLIIATSIIRPAANRTIQAYLERLHGGVYRLLHPLFDGILADTLGLPVYQEDVSRIAVSVSGFTVEKAEELRRVLGRGDREHRLPRWKRRFLEGGRRRGVAEDALSTIWEMIVSFHGYSFCKPHSASYTLVAYRLAYLKRHHPLAFMVAVINNDGGFYARQTYINEARRMGFAILGPDLNRSLELATPENGAIRLGLRFIRELPERALHRIFEARRKDGPFRDAASCSRRLDFSFPLMSRLIRSGALDSLGPTRPELLRQVLGSRRLPGLLPAPPESAADYGFERKLLEEAKTLGLVVSCHPLELFRGRIRRFQSSHGDRVYIDSREIPVWVGRRVTLAGLLVAGKEITTQSRRDMMFLSFEDAFGIYETVVFPDRFPRLYPLLAQMAVYLVEGRVVNELGAVMVEVEGIRMISSQPGEPVNGSPTRRDRLPQSRGQRTAEGQ